jgi:hypothetical protein
MPKPGPNTFSSQVKKYCVEKRDPETGALTVLGNQPPFIEATEEQITAYYFRKTPDDGRPSVSNEEIGEWYAKQGWFWRPKTW